MDVKIEERVVGHVTILNIIGRLTIDEAAQHLKNDIEDVIARGGLHIVVNLAHVPYIDSGGLGQLYRRGVFVRGSRLPGGGWAGDAGRGAAGVWYPGRPPPGGHLADAAA